MITLGVRELDGSSDSRRRFCGNKSEKSRSLPKELVGTCQVDRRSPGVYRKSAGASPRVHRMIDGSSPEEAIDAPEQVVVNVLVKIVVSTMIKLEMGGDPINLILGQLGP